MTRKWILVVTVVGGMLGVLIPMDAAGESVPMGISEEAPKKNPALSRSLGFTWQAVKDQLRVSAVAPSSPAAEGKFEKDDVILKIEKTTIATGKAFEETVRSYAPGTRLRVGVERAGNPFQRWLTLPLTSVGGLRRVGGPREIKYDRTTGLMMNEGHPFTGVVSDRNYGEGVEPAGYRRRTETDYRKGRPIVNRYYLAIQQKEWVRSEQCYDPRASRDFHSNGIVSREEVYKEGDGFPCMVRSYDPEGRLVGEKKMVKMVGKSKYRVYSGKEVIFFPDGQPKNEGEYSEDGEYVLITRDMKGMKQSVLTLKRGDGGSWIQTMISYYPNGHMGSEIVSSGPEIDDVNLLVSRKYWDDQGQPRDPNQ